MSSGSFVPSPPYAPPAPAPAPARAGLTFGQLLTLVMVVGAFALAGLFLFRHTAPGAPAAAATDYRRVAKLYGPELLAAFGDGCLDAGSAIGSGKTMGEGQVALQARFQSSRTAAFMVRVNPELQKVIAEGAEPRDAAQRAEVARFFTDLGHACKGAD